MSRVLSKYRADVFLLVWLPYALLVRRFWFVTDDAYISFRFARNLVLGHGLRFNLGDHVPVEGYSNFLWVLICAALEALKLDVTFWPLLLSAACGTALLWLVFDTLRRRLELGTPIAALATLTLGCFPPFALWSTGGLATMPFALLVFVVFERLVLREERPDGVGAGIAGLLLALIRLEGVAWCFVLAILAVVSRRIARQRVARAVIVFVLIVGVGYAAYFAWRYSYYQMPLPNTAYAKAELDLPRLTRGVNYVISHVLTFVTPILILPGSLLALGRKRLAVGLPIAAMAWAFPAYAVLVTGDFMVMGRFLVPSFAFATLLVGWILYWLWESGRIGRGSAVVVALAAIVVAGLPGWDIHVVPLGLRERFQFRFNTDDCRTEYEQWVKQMDSAVEWAEKGRALKSYAVQRGLVDSNPSYVVGAIGAVGYYSDYFIYDLPGLVTPEVAHRSVDPDEPLHSAGHDKRVQAEFFIKDRPTVFYADVLHGADPQAIADACRQQAATFTKGRRWPKLRPSYAPDLARVDSAGTTGSPAYLLAWRLVPDNTSVRDQWAAFERMLDKLDSGEHLSPGN